MTVIILVKCIVHASQAVKRFKEFDEDFACWGAERGAVGIVSSVGMLPPASVTSLQHSFPRSWNNRDPYHTPHLLFPLSHTFLPYFLYRLTHSSSISNCWILDPSSQRLEASFLKVWLQKSITFC